MSTGTRTSRSKQAEPEPEEREAGDEPAKAGPIWSRECWTGTGKVCVSIWRKWITPEGKNGFWTYNTLVKRVWTNPDPKPGEDKYVEGNSFRQEDILILSLFLQEAAAEIVTLQSQR